MLVRDVRTSDPGCKAGTLKPFPCNKCGQDKDLKVDPNHAIRSALRHPVAEGGRGILFRLSGTDRRKPRTQACGAFDKAGSSSSLLRLSSELVGGKAFEGAQNIGKNSMFSCLSTKPSVGGHLAALHRQTGFPSDTRTECLTRCQSK